MIGPQQHFLAEMEQTMWREGDVYRQRQAADAQQQSKAKIDHVASSMGSLALGAGSSSAAASRNLKRAKGGAEDGGGGGGGRSGDSKQVPKSATGWVDPNQGSNLRAARVAAQQQSGGGVSGGGWARGSGSRLVRK